MSDNIYVVGSTINREDFYDLDYYSNVELVETIKGGVGEKYQSVTHVWKINGDLYMASFSFSGSYFTEYYWIGDVDEDTTNLYPAIAVEVITTTYVKA
jgi:hypothetical protein